VDPAGEDQVQMVQEVWQVLVQQIQEAVEAQADGLQITLAARAEVEWLFYDILQPMVKQHLLPDHLHIYQVGDIISIHIMQQVQ
jgi:hypothetical protein